MIVCDLCGSSKDCAVREIEGKEYDICADCWAPLAEKLQGKGRVRRQPKTVFLPAPKEPEKQPERPVPGRPPEIWGDDPNARRV
jgi:hypothetical protein